MYEFQKHEGEGINLFSHFWHIILVFIQVSFIVWRVHVSVVLLCYYPYPEFQQFYPLRWATWTHKSLSVKKFPYYHNQIITLSYLQHISRICLHINKRNKQIFHFYRIEGSIFSLNWYYRTMQHWFSSQHLKIYLHCLDVILTWKNRLEIGNKIGNKIK